jgi:hypothetical protein
MTAPSTPNPQEAGQISRAQGARMLAAIEAYFGPENREKRSAAIYETFMRDLPGKRSKSPSTDLAVRESEAALADSKRDVRMLEARNEQLQAELDRAFDEARESRQLPAPVQVQVELKLPDSLPELNVSMKPSAGVDVIRDHDGNVIGTRPRGSSVDKVAKALKGTQAGQSIAP